MDFTIISKYRKVLMGIGILEVLLLHFFSLQNAAIPSFIATLINLVFVHGILFLSGFGMYYSYSKDNNINHFYKKRLLNVMFPYLLVAIPYYTYFFITKQQELIPIYSSTISFHGNDVLTYIGRITTLGYWVEGNFNGMWYVALTIVLYIIYPILHKLFVVSRGWVWIILIIAIIKIYPIGRHFVPDYCNMIALALQNMYIFFVGMLFGKWSYNKEIMDIEKMVVMGILCWFAPHFKYIMAMIIICYVFSKLSKSIEIIPKFFEWFGKYTLELYVLHLTIIPLFNIFHRTMDLSYYWKIAIAYSSSIVLAIIIGNFKDRIKTRLL